MSPPHANRSKVNPSPARNPKPDEVRAAREAAGLSQTQAGELVYVTLNGWQKWEAGERPMHPAFWELFRLKLKGRQGRAPRKGEPGNE